MIDHPVAPAVEIAGQLFLKNLRTCTAASHEALEAHPYSQSISEADITMGAYIRYLHAMQQVMAGMEAELYPVLSDVVPDIDKRHKSQWMHEDLCALHASENPFAAFSLTRRQSSSVPFALGAFYVLEGSMLGGRVILKSLPAALAVTAGHGARYFAGYGAETGPLWQHFIKSFCRYAVENNCEEEIITGARDTFNDIIDYFNSCQAHEAERHRQS